LQLASEQSIYITGGSMLFQVTKNDFSWDGSGAVLLGVPLPQFQETIEEVCPKSGQWSLSTSPTCLK